MSEGRMTPEQRHRVGVFARDPHSCAFAEFGGRCDGRLQADHVIEKQTLRLAWRRAHGKLYARNRLPEAIRRLRDVELDDLIADPDNGVIACQYHNFNRRLIGIPRSALPAHVEAFADRFGLGWALEEVFGPQTASQGVSGGG